jgi:phenylalanyl-tRNA synthetase beta chain
MELDPAARPGTPLAALLGLTDPVVEVAVTPNRPDCLGVRGIARDLAAAGHGILRPDARAPVPGAFAAPTTVALDFPPEAADACPIFAGRTISGLRNGPSPDWLQRRLRAIGLKPISALVDVTNYISHDRARPLHVYDAAKLRGTIRARLARPGERLLGLDGRDYALDESVCVIADDARALGLGGVLGGAETAVGPETVDVFVESAWFDPHRTAATGRRLGIESDARHRFERGVDPDFVLPGLELATRMILDLCGGTPGEVVVAGAPPARCRRLAFRPERVRQLSGLALPEAEMARILRALGFTVAGDAEIGGALWTVTTPSWRPDVEGEADLVEEVARVHGYDRLPAVALPRHETVTRPAVTPMQNRARWARRALAARGMMEAVTWSFLPHAQAALFGGGRPELQLANPISSELDAMRPSLLPNLIAAAKRNADRGFADLALFEVGPRFHGDMPGEQTVDAAGIRRGLTAPRHWSKTGRAVDVFDAKADALAVLEACGAPVAGLQVVAEAPDWYHPGRSGSLRLGPKTVLATFGELHPAVLDAMDVSGPLVGFEVVLDAIPAPKARPSKARPPLDAPDLQPVARDFAFLLDRDVPAEAVLRAARGAERGLITAVEVFDLFEGAALGPDKKSLAITVRLQPRERTLTEAEIDAVAARIVAAVTEATGGSLRG